MSACEKELKEKCQTMPIYASFGKLWSQLTGFPTQTFKAWVTETNKMLSNDPLSKKTSTLSRIMKSRLLDASSAALSS